MFAEIKVKWLEALRCGKYQQGIGSLRSRDNKFCCLGVLCDVVDTSRWEELPGAGYSFDEFSAQITEEMAAWLDIPWSHLVELVKLNDLHKLPFEWIAQYIEKNL